MSEETRKYLTIYLRAANDDYDFAALPERYHRTIRADIVCEYTGSAG